MKEQQQRQSKQPQTRRAFTKEFKRDAVELVRSSGRPSLTSPATLASTTPPWATGCAKTPSTAAKRKA
jgi:transposase-like protein